MKLVYLVSILFTVISFSGCSSKNIEQPKKVVLIEENSNNLDDEFADDEFADEFEEEFEVKEVYDPFSGYNRYMTSFNDVAYEYFLSQSLKVMDL